ncbi:MAG: glycerol-3-phosphate 1-O-acyltransferase PlsY [Verrucomicrobia bacterium]|nr:glycerol-3-phosphate 1-O-acyltransferase PlsY [Verrucomicrobiota bacterium]
MTAGIWIGCAAASYLLGSIPTGFVWCKARGIDIRKIGSGNIGATNVMRALGKPIGVTVLLIDAAKGFVPVFAAPAFFPELDRTLLQIVSCVAVVAGHNWTCWLKFKGGKGIATSAGALLAMLTLPLLCVLAVWGIVFAASRYVSLASIVAAAALPVATWLITQDKTFIIFTVILSVLAIYKHKSNIQRLLAGTENRIGVKKV